MTLDAAPALPAAVFIDNAWAAPASGETLDMIAPEDGRPFAEIAAGGPEDVDRAVRAARRALDGPWGALTAADRGQIGRAHV